MAKPRLGSGGRFRALVRKGVPPGAAAAAGRKKYGKTKFQKLAAGGRSRAAAQRKHNVKTSH